MVTNQGGSEGCLFKWSCASCLGLLESKVSVVCLWHRFSRNNSVGYDSSDQGFFDAPSLSASGGGYGGAR